MAMDYCGNMTCVPGDKDTPPLLSRPCPKCGVKIYGGWIRCPICLATFSFAHTDSVHLATQLRYQIVTGTALDEVDGGLSDDEGKKGNRDVNVRRPRVTPPCHDAGGAPAWGPSPSDGDVVSHGKPPNSRMPALRGISRTEYILLVEGC